MTLITLRLYFSPPLACACVALLFLAAPLNRAFSARSAAAPALTILDANGAVVAPGVPGIVNQIVDVTVGPSGNRVFAPAAVMINVGDTVRWTWDSSSHSVSSGSSCTFDSQFCSPNDTNCPSGVLSNVGTVYLHTFTQPGTFTYFCALHCGSGMVGSVTVQAGCLPPASGKVAWYPGDGNPRDIAGGDNGILQNGATFATGQVGQAFSFDGADDQVLVPHSALLNNSTITIDAWVNPTSSGHGRSIVNKRSASNVGGYTLESVNSPFGPDNSLQFVISIGGIYRTVLAPANTLMNNTFQHVAATYDGSVMRLYVNAVEVGNLAVSGAIDPVPDPIVIGRNIVFPVDAWQGLLDEVEIYNRALSASEILAIYNAGTTGQCKPPQPTSAVSRRTHGGAGAFDIDLVPNGLLGVECRSTAGAYQVIAQFPSTITASGASILTGTGTVSNLAVAGNTATVDLTGVTSPQRLVLELTSVSDGSQTGDVPVAMNVVVGDANGSGGVTSSDISQVKASSGVATNSGNFRADVNANGTISSSDVGLVKSTAGTQLPP